MTERYNATCERLWEKLVFYSDCFDLSWYHPGPPLIFPFDHFAEPNPLVKTLVAEVEDEFDYEMSEAQCSWAVMMYLQAFDMDAYNQRHQLAL
jgi:hypothetical protein